MMATNACLPVKAEILAIGLVHKGQYPVRCEPADKLRLVFDNIPVPLLAPDKVFLAFCQLLVVLS
ncbi:MAG: hypothetical protein A4E42_00389 [Methanoregulaceae archaeon PtaU1.Bin222]|nr:MAG: hypothetical protein A4E42_00389 [Methanoregulaceae archaeon PtaU1.Bin222]